MLRSLQVGDELEVKGPIPKFKLTPNMKKNIGGYIYAQRPLCSMREDTRVLLSTWTDGDISALAGMIAGGSGLTPMMQVASQILANKDDKTQASLLWIACSNHRVSASSAVASCFSMQTSAGLTQMSPTPCAGLAGFRQPERG